VASRFSCTFEVLDGAVVTYKYKSVRWRDIYNNKTFSPLGALIHFVDLTLGCLYHMDVGSVAYILEVHAVFHLQG
jgi:hypothetical protein